jgi:hypothetical protein
MLQVDSDSSAFNTVKDALAPPHKANQHQLTEPGDIGRKYHTALEALARWKVKQTLALPLPLPLQAADLLGDHGYVYL